MMGSEGGNFNIWVSRSLLENAFLINFLTSNDILCMADKHHFSREYYGLVIKYTKSHHPKRCIKVSNKPDMTGPFGPYMYEQKFQFQ